MICTLIAVAASWFAASWIMSRYGVSRTTSGSLTASTSVAAYTNVKGQKWSIPTGNATFTVSSAESYPKFVSGNINPVSVSIGQTQTMSIVVRDNVPIVKVWAEIENDNGTDTVPLAMGSSSAVSYDEIQNQKYLVDGAGHLVINSSSTRENEIQNLVLSLVQKANAEQAIDYSYKGSWVAHNTRNITYHTTFYAEDTLGRTTNLVLAWSDPTCSAVSGILQSPCVISSVWGLDGAGQNLSLGGYAITMQSGGTLVYNSGNSISYIKPGSQIVSIASNAEIVKANLFYTDADGDGYAPNNIMTYNTASSLRGYVRVSAALGTNDCDDYNSSTYPGQTAWFTTPIVDSGGPSVENGTYNYNCSGVLSEELQPTGSETSLAYSGTPSSYTVYSYWNGSSCTNLGSATTTLLIPIAAGGHFGGSTGASIACGSTGYLLANSSTYYGGSGCTGTSYVLIGNPARTQACNGGEFE